MRNLTALIIIGKSQLLSIKSIFFYPGIILCTGWTLLNFAKVAHYVENLKNEFPACTASNPNRVLIFISTILVLMLVKAPTESASRNLFNRSLPEAKFPHGSDGRKQKAEMLGERIFKLIANIFCVASLVYIMRRDDCDFMDVRVGGRSPRALFFVNYPC